MECKGTEFQSVEKLWEICSNSYLNCLIDIGKPKKIGCIKMRGWNASQDNYSIGEYENNKIIIIDTKDEDFDEDFDENYYNEDIINIFKNKEEMEKIAQSWSYPELGKTEFIYL